MKSVVVFSGMVLLASAVSAQQLRLFEDEKTKKYGYKNDAGKIIVQPIYSLASEFEKDNYVEVNIGADYKNNKGGKWGALDKSGKVVIPVKYDRISYLGYNLFAVNTGHVFSNMDASPSGKFAIFNSAGKPLTPFVYTGFLPRRDAFEGGYLQLTIFDKLKKTSKYGMLDSTGKLAIPVMYDDISGFSKEGLARVQLNGKSGYVDKKNKQVLPLKYEDAGMFWEGLAAVKIGGKWGYIDPKGDEIISPQYEEARYFELGGYAGVKKDGKWGVIDKSNQTVLAFNFDGVVNINNDGNDIRVKSGNNYINVDRSGKEIKKDKMAKSVMDVYNLFHSSHRQKIKDLLSYLKSSMMQDSRGEFVRTYWRSNSVQLQNHIKEVKAEISEYRGKLQGLGIRDGENELYYKLIVYLQSAENFSGACAGWAQQIYDMDAEMSTLVKQLEILETRSGKMKKDDDAVMGFVGEYKKRNDL